VQDTQLKTKETVFHRAIRNDSFVKQSFHNVISKWRYLQCLIEQELQAPTSQTLHNDVQRLQVTVQQVNRNVLCGPCDVPHVDLQLPERFAYS